MQYIKMFTSASKVRQYLNFEVYHSWVFALSTHTALKIEICSIRFTTTLPVLYTDWISLKHWHTLWHYENNRCLEFSAVKYSLHKYSKIVHQKYSPFTCSYAPLERCMDNGEWWYFVSVSSVHLQHLTDDVYKILLTRPIQWTNCNSQYRFLLFVSIDKTTVN